MSPIPGTAPRIFFAISRLWCLIDSKDRSTVPFQVSKFKQSSVIFRTRNNDSRLFASTEYFELFSTLQLCRFHLLDLANKSREFHWLAFVSDRVVNIKLVFYVSVTISRTKNACSFVVVTLFSKCKISSLCAGIETLVWPGLFTHSTAGAGKYWTTHAEPSSCSRL